MTAAGFTALPEKRADWGFELEDSPLGGGLVIIVNAHRAGRTRRSTEPERMVHRFTGELAVGGGLKVVIERDLPDVRLAHDHLVVALQPSSSEEGVGHLSDGTDIEVLRALALAEVRRAPLPVWTALAQALGSHVGRSLDVATTLEASGEILEVEGDGWVRFRDERHAETLRLTTDAEIVRAVNVELVAWLRDQPAAATTGQYLTQGLAMHAVQAGEFDSVQRSGRLVARIDQVALIDAAHADDSYVVNGASPAGDAVNLWMCGVDSLSQGEWASWLHLMSTVRGDTETAAQIASSGQPLPWQVRWAHWRPPGALNAAYVRPGPLGDPVIAPEDYLPGRHAVSAPGEAALATVSLLVDAPRCAGSGTGRRAAFRFCADHRRRRSRVGRPRQLRAGPAGSPVRRAGTAFHHGSGGPPRTRRCPWRSGLGQARSSSSSLLAARCSLHPDRP
jgi:hypothetical protein